MAEVDSRRRWLTLAGVGTLAAATGYAVYRWRGDGLPDDTPNEAAVQALLAAPMRNPQGDSKTVGEWRGKVLVVNFWATWCGPCRQEIPEFVKMQEHHRARGLQFVGIAIDQPQPVSVFAREFHINYPLLIGGLDTLALMREAGNRSGVLPFTLILDRQGKVIRSYRGALTESALEAVVRPLF